MRIDSIHIKNFKGINDVEIINCGSINAFVGKNNSRKSSLLHAIDISSLAHYSGSWNQFQPKLEIRDIINDAGNFEISLKYENGHITTIKAHHGYNPDLRNPLDQNLRPKSILIYPDVGVGQGNRNAYTPNWIIQRVENRDFNQVNSLEILWAIKYFSDRNQRGFTPQNYEDLIHEISIYFPDIETLESDISAENIPTLIYKEYGKKHDILYSGTGLKHFLDVLVKTTISGANIILLDEPELGLHPDLQRKFFKYLQKMVNEKDAQIFIGTHSQIVLTFTDIVSFYRIINKKGVRELLPVRKDSIETVLSDLGVKPSDIFNHDLCLLVEGQSDVIFWEHIIRNMYYDEFQNIAVGIIQYGGGNVGGIINGNIEVKNIVSSQKYTYWIHDRDAEPGSHPSINAQRFKRKLNSFNIKNKIFRKREIEFYYPEIVHVKAQCGDRLKENATKSILHGTQTDKYRNLATGICVPSGKYLKKLLKENVRYKKQLNSEIKTIIKYLLKWKGEILGE